MPYGPGVTPPPPAGLRVQNLLLGLGTGLLAVAAVVFTAVNWDRLDAGLQAVALLVVTAVLAAVTVAAARHRMPATAEAVGLVTLLMALVDAHAVRVGGLPQVDAVAYWAVALAVVAGAAWALALVSGIVATRMGAVVLGQLPLLLGLVATQASTTGGELALLGQVTAVLGLAHVARRSAPAVRALAAAVAACTWGAVVTAATLQVLLEGPGTGPGVRARGRGHQRRPRRLVAPAGGARAGAGPGGRIGRRGRGRWPPAWLWRCPPGGGRPCWPGSPPAWRRSGSGRPPGGVPLPPAWPRSSG